MTVAPTLDAGLRRLLGEYLALPGLSLTPSQARRLAQLDADTCERVLDLLIRERWLAWRTDGQLVLSSVRGVSAGDTPAVSWCSPSEPASRSSNTR